MNIFIAYIRDFLRTTDTWLLLCCTCFTVLIIFFNYRYGIETKILYNLPNKAVRFAGFYLVYLIAFGTPYLLVFLFKGKAIAQWPLFVFLLLVAPAIFSLKVNFAGVTEWIQNNRPGVWGRYFAIILILPSRLVLLAIPLLLIWWLGKYETPFFGVTTHNFEWRPYVLMLLIMLPLIAWASTQPDFLNTYPKLKQVAFIGNHTSKPWLYKFLYELSYGMDFITIELFFRGFLVLAFVRFAGQDAIIPMAVFYCSIHFGKPLMECISSFFGGLLLGIVVYHTKSITGGLVVHLGIAWLMEAGAVMGHFYKK